MAGRRIFLLSPANCGGERAQLLFAPGAQFELARRLRDRSGAPLGEVMSFVSGLYFRGKLTYAARFGVPLVITPHAGLRPPEEIVTLARLRAAARVDIHPANRRYLRPLLASAPAVASVPGPDAAELARSATATRDHHPARRTRSTSTTRPVGPVEIPHNRNDAEVDVGDRVVRLTNLTKVFWPAEGITKGDLLRYYAVMAPVLLPHIRDRAMVMKRYPNGATGEFFFMKRAPKPRPEWIELCSIQHESGNVIDFPMVQDLPSLLWVVNLGCIHLNQWYARCDDANRPDDAHFDLD